MIPAPLSRWLRAAVARGRRALATASAVATRMAAAAIRPFDLRDLFFFVGLVLAGAGGFQLSRPWTLIAIGAVLAAVGLFTRAPRAGGE